MTALRHINSLPKPLARDLSAHADLVAVQKRLVQQLEKEMGWAYMPGPGEDAYADAFLREFEKIERISSKNELLKHIRRSSLLYIADCHTLGQAQRAAVRLIAEAQEDRDRRLIIGLEMLQTRHQQYADQYLAGEISETRFLESIRYSETWGFNWGNFRLFFDLARKLGAKVVGLNADSEGDDPLGERDRLASELIVSLTTAFPDALIAVVYGDLHMASDHIPGEVARRLSSRGMGRKHTIVYQNAEPVYWALAQRHMQDSVEVVKLQRDRFCVLSATPLAKVHSYLHTQNPGSLENALAHVAATHATGSFRLDELEGFDDTVDITESVIELVHTVADYFRLPRPDVSDLSVAAGQGPEDIGSGDAHELYNAEERDRLRQVLRRRRSAWLSRPDAIVLQTANLDQAAEEATRFLHSMLSRPKAGRGVRRALDDDTELALVSPQTRETFYRAVMASALGWLGSKVINHKRQTDKLPDFQDYLAANHGRRLKGRKADKREVARHVVRHKEMEARFFRAGKSRLPVCRSLEKLPAAVVIRLAHALGCMLGDALYRGMVQGEFDRSELRELFISDLRGHNVAYRAYLQWVERTRDIRDKFRARAEQL